MKKGKLEIADFIVSEKQREIDMKILPYDVWATKVHILMLENQKILTKVQAKKCVIALNSIEKELKSGKFKIDPNRGAQLTLEKKIVEKAGDVGLSVHTGRSRNDQIMTAEMLYLREQLAIVYSETLELVKLMVKQAAKHQGTVMPGYTHMQPGKITTFGQWLLAYSAGILSGIDKLSYLLTHFDKSPLGSVESYGTSWNLDRKFSADLLGFADVWEIPQDAISSRGLPQLGYIEALANINLTISKIVSDLILFNTYEYNFVELGANVAQRLHPLTGSSVMAQKKNPDVLELLRSNTSQVINIWPIVANILKNLPMGYNRDSRDVKEYIEMAINKSSVSIVALTKVIEGLEVNEQKMKQSAMENYSLTTELADYISQKTKVGYRIIYKVVGVVVDDLMVNKKPIIGITAHSINNQAEKMGLNFYVSDKDIQDALNVNAVIERRKHIGGSSKASFAKSVNSLNSQIKKNEIWLKKFEDNIERAKAKTEKRVKKL